MGLCITCVHCDTFVSANKIIDWYNIIILKYVAVSELQVAILVRLSREMSQTVRIDWQYILSWARVSVRPSIFFYKRKTHKICRDDRVPYKCLFNVPVTVDWSPATLWAATTAIIAAKYWAKTATTRVYTFATWNMFYYDEWIIIT